MSENLGPLHISLSVILGMVLTAAYQSLTLIVDSFWLIFLPSEWVMLVVFFWVMVLPHRLSFILFWLVGFLLDVLYQHPLGLNGACLAAIVYVGQQIYDAYYEESERRMHILLVAMFTVVAVVKGSLLAVLLDVAFSPMQFLTILVSVGYVVLLVFLRRFWFK